jgi:hypothetical protein
MSCLRGRISNCPSIQFLYKKVDGGQCNCTPVLLYEKICPSRGNSLEDKKYSALSINDYRRLASVLGYDSRSPFLSYPLEFLETLKTCFMLYNLYNPDTKNGRKRISKRAYRFYNNLPGKGYTNWNLAKVILITILLMSLSTIYFILSHVDFR